VTTSRIDSGGGGGGGAAAGGAAFAGPDADIGAGDEVDAWPVPALGDAAAGVALAAELDGEASATAVTAGAGSDEPDEADGAD
jgi:hypothetical protein